MKDKLLVIIVTFNAMPWLRLCLDSVINSTQVADIYIKDNGSTDETLQIIRHEYPQVILDDDFCNLGFGAANNRGFRYALQHSYDYVYLLNQDAWVERDVFEKLIRVFKDNSEFGILSPIQMQANKKHFDKNFATALQRPSSNGSFIEEFFFKTGTLVIPIEKVMAAHWMVSSKCLFTVGGFSPAFPHYGEDDNYCIRAAFHKMKVGVVVDAFAVHDRQYRKDPKEKLIYFDYIKCLIELTDLNKEPIGRFAIIKRYLSSLRKWRTFLPLRYLVRLQKDYRTIISYRSQSETTNSFL